MIKYRVWQEAAEARTESNKDWSEQEILSAYDNRLDAYPNTLKEFDSEDEATAYYQSLEPSSTRQFSSHGTMWIEYEVIGLTKVTLDDSGEEVEWDDWERKTSPITFEEGE